MKPIILLFTFISLAIFSPAFSQTSDNNLSREDDAEFKLERQHWIESMHRTAPDVNWHILDAEFRNAKYQRQFEQWKSNNLLGISPNQSTQTDTIGGALKGNWAERGSSNLAGRMLSVDVDFDRNLIFGASAGNQIWKGNLDGSGWTCRTNSMRFDGIVMLQLVQKGANKRLITAGGKDAYFSDDDGATWTKANGFSTIERWGWFARGIMADDATHTIYLLGTEWDYKNWKSVVTLYMSKDLGENYTNIAQFDLNDNQCDIWAARYGNSGTYLRHGDTLSGILPNGTLSRISLPNLNSPESVFLQGCFYNNITTLYAWTTKGTTGTLFVSNDKGLSFSSLGTTLSKDIGRNTFAVSTMNPQAIFGGGIDLLRTYNQGKTWDKPNTWGEYYGNPKGKLHADIQNITFLRTPQNTEIALISNDGGLYRSSDAIKTVENIGLSGLGISQYYGTYTAREKPYTIFAGAQDQGYQRSVADTVPFVKFDQLISGDYGHLKSSNLGRSLWMNYPGFTQYYNIAKGNGKRYTHNFFSKGHLWLAPLTADPTDSSAAYVAAGSNSNSSLLWRFKVSGDSLKADSLPFDFSGTKHDQQLSAIEFSPINPNYAYALNTAGTFFFSTDAGKTWDTSTTKGPGNHYFYGSSILPSPVTLGKIFIGGSGYSNPAVYVSMNNGKTFAPLDTGLPKTLVYSLATTPDEQYIFAATEVGPYVFIPKKGMWFDMAGSTAPDQTFWSVEYVPALRTARFGTYGRGIWDFNIADESASGVNKEIPSNGFERPTLFASPNPLSESSKLTVWMPKQVQAELRIFDLTGRIVATIQKGILPEGTSEFEWNIKTNGGEIMPSGAYIAVLSAMNDVFYVVLKVAR